MQCRIFHPQNPSVKELETFSLRNWKTFPQELVNLSKDWRKVFSKDWKPFPKDWKTGHS
jgi:hypothetical protein